MGFLRSHGGSSRFSGLGHLGGYGGGYGGGWDYQYAEAQRKRKAEEERARLTAAAKRYEDTSKVKSRAQGRLAGQFGTILTGAKGVTPSEMLLGRTSLLGA